MMQIKPLQPNNNELGFTLMEIVVGLAVFSIALISLTDIFLLSQRTQNKLVGETRIQADARFVMEVLAREIRMNTINYEAVDSGDLADPLILPYLPLKDLEGNTLMFIATSSDSGICEAGATNCLAVKRNNSAWASITPRGVNVISAKFYIYPATDPFSTADNNFGPASQPRVTIVMTSENINTRAGENNTQYLQTTVSSRVYKRF
jgi:prepilin-type N-terminal cleavage/methylation domain-containing protein